MTGAAAATASGGARGEGLAGAVAAHLRTTGLAFRLGFAMESNWAPLWAYFLYMLVRPVATSAIIVVMYLVSGTRDAGMLTYMFVGNALFTFVGNVLFGINQTVIEDREHYQMLKYVYTAPISIYAFLVGRGLVKLVFAAFSVAVTLAFGALFLPIRFDAAAADWGRFALSCALGLSSLVFFGILLAGVTLNTARHSYFLSESISGVVYLFCGAVFPPAILPHGLREAALALPVTHWIELARRALVGRPPFPTGLEGTGDGTLLAILVASTLVACAGSLLGYRALERRARAHGRLDQKTDY